MLIPKKIKIGSSEYTIKEKIYLFNDLAGQIRYGNLKLHIKENMTSRAKEDAFFHEIAHGTLKELEFNYPKITVFRADETFVQELGLILRKIFLDLLEKQDNNVVKD